MEYSEMDVAAAFGVEPEEETGSAAAAERTQENAPAGETAAAQAVEEAATAAPAEATGIEADNAAQPQTAEERRRQAHGRRQREEAERQRQMEQMVQQRVDGVYATIFGTQIDPATGKPIDSEAGYLRYIGEARQQQAQQQLQAAGVDPAMIEQLVDARLAPLTRAEQMRQASDMEARAKAYTQQAEAAIAAGVENIRKAYGADVHSIEDIVAMPTGARFAELIGKGISIEDSFFLANREALQGQQAKAAWRRGAEAALGTGHLATPKASNANAPYVATAEERRDYRAFIPDATDEEINRAYASMRNADGAH